MALARASRRTERKIARYHLYAGRTGSVILAAGAKALTPLAAILLVGGILTGTATLAGAGAALLAVGVGAWFGISASLAAHAGTGFWQTVWDIWMTPTWWSFLQIFDVLP